MLDRLGEKFSIGEEAAVAGRAASILGFERLRAGQPEAARDAFLQALPHLEGEDAQLWKGRTYANLGEALVAMGCMSEGCNALARASRSLRGAREEEEAALVLARLGSLLHAQGNEDEGLRRMRKAVSHATRARIAERGTLRANLALAEATAGHLDIARNLLRQSARNAQNSGMVREEAFACFALASVLSETGGRDDEVREALKHGLVLARSHRSSRLSAAGLFLAVVSRVLRGRPDAAELALQAAEAELRRAARKATPGSPDGRILGLLSTAIAGGTMDLRTGELDEARWRAHAAAVRPPLALMHLRPVLLRPDIGDSTELALDTMNGSWEF